MKRWIGWLLVALLVLGAGSALAQTYNYPQEGLRLDLPEGWSVLTQEQRNALYLYGPDAGEMVMTAISGEMQNPTAVLYVTHSDREAYRNLDMAGTESAYFALTGREAEQLYAQESVLVENYRARGRDYLIVQEDTYVSAAVSAPQGLFLFMYMDTRMDRSAAGMKAELLAILDTVRFSDPGAGEGPLPTILGVLAGVLLVAGVYFLRKKLKKGTQKKLNIQYRRFKGDEPEPEDEEPLEAWEVRGPKAEKGTKEADVPAGEAPPKEEAPEEEVAAPVIEEPVPEPVPEPAEAIAPMPEEPMPEPTLEPMAYMRETFEPMSEEPAPELAPDPEAYKWEMLEPASEKPAPEPVAYRRETFEPWSSSAVPHFARTEEVDETEPPEPEKEPEPSPRKRRSDRWKTNEGSE